jgi:RHS repeat-associated protein
MKNNFTTAAQDRLGSMGSYYPYGEEYATTQQDQVKFATYYRDTTTVLDYARNRYYSSTLGRFLTADPYRATASSVNNPADPGSWNRYAYTRNDSVNRYDPWGLDDCEAGESCPSGLLPGTGMRTNPNRPVPPDGPDPVPPCARDKEKLKKTVTALADNILEVAKASGIGAAGMTALQNVTDAEISDMTSNPAFVAVIGGHINLTIPVGELQDSLSNADYDKFQADFSGAIFGQRRDAGAVTMHSDEWKKQQVFDFHFDLFNPKKDVIDLIGHLFGDVIGGHIGKPCLDPAWTRP